MSTFDNLWDEFEERFSRAPVWLPGTPLSVGDIGVIDRRGFLTVAKLADFGITFDTKPSSVPVAYDVNSSNSSTQDFGLGLAAADPTAIVASAQAGLRAHFPTGGASSFERPLSGAAQFEDVLKVEKAIRAKHDATHFWDKNWIYVQEVVTAQRVVLLVSQMKGAHATVGGEATAGIGSFRELLDAGTNLRHRRAVRNRALLSHHAEVGTDVARTVAARNLPQEVRQPGRNGIPKSSPLKPYTRTSMNRVPSMRRATEGSDP